MCCRGFETCWKLYWIKSRPFPSLSAQLFYSSCWLPERYLPFPSHMYNIPHIRNWIILNFLNFHWWLNNLCVFQVVEYILDRNACLLPAYFAVTEIRKFYPEGQLAHWVSGLFLCVCKVKPVCVVVVVRIYLSVILLFIHLKIHPCS